jgi:hypothetical protein
MNFVSVSVQGHLDYFFRPTPSVKWRASSKLPQQLLCRQSPSHAATLLLQGLFPARHPGLEILLIVVARWAAVSNAACHCCDLHTGYLPVRVFVYLLLLALVHHIFAYYKNFGLKNCDYHNEGSPTIRLHVGSLQTVGVLCS